MKPDLETPTTEAAPEKKLGLSKLVYGLGLSARDALVSLVGATAVMTPIMYFGREKSSIIRAVADSPDKLHGWWKKLLGEEKSGKAGTALLAAAGVATLISWVAHIPGLFKGPKKVAEADALYKAEIDMNQKLMRANTLLAEDNERLTYALADTEKKRRSFQERVMAGEGQKSNTPSMM